MVGFGLFSAVFLGVLQGFAEWLPISSSGQLVLFLVGILGIESQDALSFAFYLHFGTLLAVLLRFREEVKDVVIKIPKWKDDKRVEFLVISTLVSFAVGLPLYIFLKEGFKNWQGDLVTGLVGLMLILTGVVLFFTKKKFGGKDVEDMGTGDMIAAGAAQGISILPGVSRSGMTLSALLLRNIRQKDALVLSFLMSIPATLGVIAFELVSGSMAAIGILPILAGILAAFVVGYIMIDALLAIARKVEFGKFCIIFGIIAIAAVVVFL